MRTTALLVVDTKEIVAFCKKQKKVVFNLKSWIWFVLSIRGQRTLNLKGNYIMDKSKIRNTILSSESASVFAPINETIFEDDVYHPDRDVVNRRAILLFLFAPDYMAGKEGNGDAVFTEEADEIFAYLEENSRQYREIKASMDRWIEHRLRLTENGGLSLTDYALGRLVETLNEKVKGLDITDDGIKAVEEAVGKTKDNDFANNLVDAFLDKGLLKKPNRETRRANGQKSTVKKAAKKKEPIKLDVEETKD